MHDMNKDMELSKYRFSLAEETYKVQKCVLIMDFTETVLIDLIMRCFMAYVLSLHWTALISKGIKMLWPISIKSLLHPASFRGK